MAWGTVVTSEEHPLSRPHFNLSYAPSLTSRVWLWQVRGLEITEI